MSYPGSQPRVFSSTSGCCHLLAVWLSESVDFAAPQSPHLKNGLNDSLHTMGLS